MTSLETKAQEVATQAGIEDLLPIIEIVFEIWERCSSNKQGFVDCCNSPTPLQKMALRRITRRSLRDNGIRPTRSCVSDCCNSIIEKGASLAASDLEEIYGECGSVLGYQDE